MIPGDIFGQLADTGLDPVIGQYIPGWDGQTIAERKQNRGITELGNAFMEIHRDANAIRKKRKARADAEAAAATEQERRSRVKETAELLLGKIKELIARELSATGKADAKTQKLVDAIFEFKDYTDEVEGEVHYQANRNLFRDVFVEEKGMNRARAIAALEALRQKTLKNETDGSVA